MFHACRRYAASPWAIERLSAGLRSRLKPITPRGPEAEELRRRISKVLWEESQGSARQSGSKGSAAEIHVIHAVDLAAKEPGCQTLELVRGIRHVEPKRPVIVCSNVAAAIGQHIHYNSCR